MQGSCLITLSLFRIRQPQKLTANGSLHTALVSNHKDSVPFGILLCPQNYCVEGWGSAVLF